ncbi:MAG: type II toxin-antitoxin system RelE/ParE family toxin [Collinsella intestinalis]|uniref:Type II toxin-antitoxin system RelE/ParE family toxin n=1 Tax=Collinsella intestinalis TaxID=147207 RepID=A0A943GPN5_9ACTN|nr:type II toxin-antitoxin system RelE/ParE family toxin [Collinsella intestinalis]
MQAGACLTCSFPESKPLCPDPHLSSRGYRSFQVKNYIALYPYSDGIVYVDHVFHRSQDYAAPVVENAE